MVPDPKSLAVAANPKPPDYYASDRSSFLDWIGPAKSVLDLGCGAGWTGRWFKSNGAEKVVGVEVDDASARIAEAYYDRVYREPIESALGRLECDFDLIVCADVLEHLVDPWEVVRGLRLLAAPHTRLALSIPNIRYWRAVWQLAFGKGFEYEVEGIFDATHLRFFTRSSIASMLAGGGWEVERWGRSLRSLSARAVSKASLHFADEWLAYQWYVLASPAPGRG